MASDGALGVDVHGPDKKRQKLAKFTGLGFARDMAEVIVETLGMDPIGQVVLEQLQGPAGPSPTGHTSYNQQDYLDLMDFLGVPMKGDGGDEWLANVMRKNHALGELPSPSPPWATEAPTCPETTWTARPQQPHRQPHIQRRPKYGKSRGLEAEIGDHTAIRTFATWRLKATIVGAMNMKERRARAAGSELRDGKKGSYTGAKANSRGLPFLNRWGGELNESVNSDDDRVGLEPCKI
ncbi:hypothetical protein VOLCADRAFT_106814 [Volvox carteri f. nagariensis]|uniref:Uncharacterized protein n=1 Tax=Volvox carteri f. nagariensis TaxID=3068 RepID=D8U9Y6_VOLCA|nr:uncharacterized protein VOLCADRAFT_106814 [Volvox carteri f. nagariensis]EFJ43493.1 hypothetical protein VOLCADRAFT_106814 [Volvox carteri f. nagariensis]|eukprot:XP_002955422.1 hypothetical protein VOLCADRAFT_106814 [Volvox carteri f. nagariensis]